MENFSFFPDQKMSRSIDNTRHIGLDTFCKLIVNEYYKLDHFPGKSDMITDIIKSGINYLSSICRDPNEILALQQHAKSLMDNISKSKRDHLRQMSDATFYNVRNDRSEINPETHRNALFTFTDLKEIVPLLQPKAKKAFGERSLSIIDHLYEMVKMPIEVKYAFDIHITHRKSDEYLVTITTDLAPSKENPIFTPYKGYMSAHFYTNRHHKINSFYVDKDTLELRSDFWDMLVEKCDFSKIANGSSKKYTITGDLYSHRGKSTLKLGYNKKTVYVGSFVNKDGRGRYSFTKKRRLLTDSQIRGLMKIYPSTYYNPIIYQSHAVTADVIDFVSNFYCYHDLELFQIALADWFTRRPHTFPAIISGATSLFHAQGLISPTLAAQNILVTPNDVHIDHDHLGHIITGRNAGGKTSFIDMIGISLLLGQNGWPLLTDVAATLTPFGDIHLHYIEPNTISIGKSRFLDELTRIKELLPRLDPGDLILMDEPFTGTSYKDGKRKLKDLLKALAQTDCKILCTTHLSAIIPNVESILGYHNLHVGTDFTVKAGGDASSHGAEIANAVGLSYSDMQKLVKHLHKKK